VSAYSSVSEFERQMASWAGAKHGIATDSCTSALFLCCKRLRVDEVTLPAKTYVSVPMAVIHAGGSVKFKDYQWGGVYQLKPYPIFDGALRMRRGMYEGGFHCLSFQAKKHLPIGKAGMILTDDGEEAQWFRSARSNGRNFEMPYQSDRISMLGWNFSMTPEQASRGLQLLEGMTNKPDLANEYPDLREMPVFA
jgi:dTDP-4-amino-4,6-dideoxygalactose transaminase